MPIKFDYSELRGKIKAKYGTEYKFSRELGHYPQYLSRIFKGTSYFTMQDIVKSCELLEIPPEEIGFFFYAH